MIILLLAKLIFVMPVHLASLIGCSLDCQILELKVLLILYTQMFGGLLHYYQMKDTSTMFILLMITLVLLGCILYKQNLKLSLHFCIFILWLKDSLTRTLCVCKVTGVENIEVLLLYFNSLEFVSGTLVLMLTIKMVELRESTGT